MFFLVDLKQQQLRSMVGATAGGATAQTFGVHFEANSYTLFSGVYALGNPNNIVVLTGTVAVTNNLPTSQIVFSRLSGEVAGFSAAQNTITFTNSGLPRTVTINKYGVVAIN